MTFALLQMTLDVPPVENLKRAFRSLPNLTDYDAHILAQDAHGILIRNLSQANAGTLRNALLREGIETEIVAESCLPQLPPAKVVRQIACTAEALMLHDPIGRPFPLPWEHVFLLAAGNVRLTDFKQHRTERKITSYGDSGVPITEIRVDYSTREKVEFSFLLEVFVTRAVLRYSITVDKPFLTRYLGDRFDGDVSRGSAMLIQDLCGHIPAHFLNRGANLLREGSPQAFAYPAKNAFYEEITWMLWRHERAKS